MIGILLASFQAEAQTEIAIPAAVAQGQVDIAKPQKNASASDELLVDIPFSARHLVPVDELTFTFHDQSYLNRNDPPAGQTDYAIVSAHLRTHSDTHPFVAATLELSGDFATNVDHYSNIELPEAYLDFRTRLDSQGDDKIQLTVGRMKETWSDLDSDWRLGLIQPLDRFDGFHTTEQGFTGGFINIKLSGFECVAFGSAIYIPEQGPSYDLENGQFTTTNPWFQLPPTTLYLSDSNGAAIPVRYTINTPSVGSVISHSSLGLILRYHRVSEPGFYASLSYVRKPRNALDFAFTGQEALTTGGQYGDIGVYPEILYHQLASADVGYNARYYSIGLSALNEVVENETLGADLTYQHYDPLALLSPSIELRVMPEVAWMPWLRVARLYSFGGSVSSVGPNAVNGSIFGSRNTLSQAFSVSEGSRLWQTRRWRIDQGLKFIDEVSEQGSMLNAEVRFAYRQAWRAIVGVDLIGSSQPLSTNSTFISRFRSNSRANVGLTYVF
jgi:hypothetical protein